MKKIFIIVLVLVLGGAPSIGILFLFPHVANAITCGAGTDIGGGQCREIITAGTTWTVPTDWTSTNAIEVIGGSGGGGNGGVGDGANGGSGGGGGGGGGYSRADNVTLTPSAVLNIQLGSGGGTTTAGTDTYFNRGASATTTCSTQEPQTSCAKGGGAGANGALNAAPGSGGAGGVAASGVGGTKFSGGNGLGGGGFTAGHDYGSGGGGGGGAGGTTAAGSNGTIGGASTAAAPAGAGGAGGAGGANSGGTAGSAGVGGNLNGGTGGAGGAGSAWTTAGAGGGAGGGGANGRNATAQAGSGGYFGGGYGGGGAGGGGAARSSGLGIVAGNGSKGNNGVIVITYTPAAAPITISGILYGLDAVTPNTTAGRTIRMRVGTSTAGFFSTTTIAGTGVWRISNITATGVYIGMPIHVWVDGDPNFTAFTFTKASTTADSITSLDLYQNRVTLKHEGFTATSTTNADLAVYDRDDDTDIPYTSVAAGAFNMTKGHELRVAPGSEYAPGGAVTLHGNASTTNPDGDLYLPTGTRQDGVATTSILTMGANSLTLAGNWFASSTSIFTHSNETTFNSTSTSQRNIIATSSPFNQMLFNGSGGSWTFGANAATSSNNVNISAGTLTAPSTNFSLNTNLTRSGGFLHNSGTVVFYSATAQSLISQMNDTNAFNHLIFRGAGTKSFIANAASTSNLTIESTSGTVTLPSTRLTIAGNYSNSSAINANGGTVYFSSTTAQTIAGTMTGTSAFATTTFLGVGTKTFSSNASSTGHFIVATSAVVVAPTLLTIGGNYENAGTFTAGSNTVYFSSTTAQSISGTATGTSAFATTTFIGSGVKTFSANASTTNFFIESGASVTAPSLLSIGRNYTNAGTFTRNGGSVLLDGSVQQTLSGSMTAASAFHNLSILNTSGTGGGTQSIVFGAAASTTGAFTMYASTSAQFLSAATSSFSTVALNGGSASTRVWLRASGATTYGFVATSSITATYVDVANAMSCGDAQGIAVTANYSYDGGNNCGWSFVNTAVRTFSGFLRGMNRTTAHTGESKTIKLAIGTSTPGVFTTTTNSDTGAWSIVTDAIEMFLGQRFIAWVDGDSTFTGATFSKASTTDATTIAGIDILRNRVVVKHEGFTATSTTNADLAFYDFDNDTDIPFTSVAAGAYSQMKGHELMIAAGSNYAPAGSVTLHGNASTTNPDGDLYLPTGARQDGVATTSILTMGPNGVTLAGNWFASSTAIFAHNVNETFSSTSTQQKIIIASSTSFYSPIFNGIGGSWTFGSNSATTTSGINILNGTLIAPSTNLSIGSNFSRSGSFVHNSGTINFYGTSGQAVQSIMTGANAFNNVIFRGAGTKTFDTNAASTTDLTIESTSGTVTFPSTNLSISGNFVNNGTITAMGTTTFDGASAQTISGTLTGSSQLGTTTFAGAGTKTFSSNASTTKFFIASSSGTVTAPSGLLGIRGDYFNNNVFAHNNGTTSFEGAVLQNLYGNMTGTSAFKNVEFSNSGGAIIRFQSYASTSHFFIRAQSGADISSRTISIAGNYWANPSLGQGATILNSSSATVLFDGADQTFSGFMSSTGSDLEAVRFMGSGTKTFSNNATTTDFTIDSGVTVVAPTLLSVNKNYTNNGAFTAGGGTVYFGSNGLAQSISGIATGTSAFATTTFISAGTKTFSVNASTTNFFIESGSGAVTAPTLLSVSRNFTNSGTFTANGGTVLLDGTSQQTLSGTMTGTSAFSKLTISNTSGTGGSSGIQSIVFGAAASTTGAFTMNASTSAQFLASATSSFATIALNGTGAATRVWLRSSISGTRAGFVVTSSAVADYVDVMDISSCGDPSGISITQTTLGYDSGNNCGWSFGTTPTLDLSYYRFRLDDGDLVFASGAAAENTANTSSLYVGDRRRLRMTVSNSGTGAATGYQYRLEVASTSCSSWLQVGAYGTTNTHWIMDETSSFNNGQATADWSGVTNPASKTFTTGFAMATTSQAPAHTLSTTQFSEFEFSIRTTTAATTATTYCFRLTNAGSTTNFNYATQPQASVREASSRPSGGGNNLEANGVGAQVGGGGASGGGAGEGSGGGPPVGGGGAGGGGGGVE